MIGVFEMQTKNGVGVKGTKMYKLTVARKQFYSSLLNSTPTFAGTYLEHVSLKEAAKKLITNQEELKEFKTRIRTTSLI
jgi:hypothetical protein